MSVRLSGELINIYCDHSSAVTLQEQIVTQLRDAIVSGRLRPHTMLPPSRVLAQRQNVARNTVVLSYEQLIAEGYVITRKGSGTYVSDHLPETRTPTVAPTTLARQSGLGLSKRGLEIVSRSPQKKVPLGLLAPTFPDTTHFPFKTFARMISDSWSHPKSALRDHDGDEGYMPLREAVASYLGQFRGVACEAENIILTTLVPHNLLYQLLLDPGDQAWVEEPGMRAIKAGLAAASADAVPIPVDEQGIRVDLGIELAPDASLAAITPTRQYPLGAVLAQERREALLQWASASGSWIIETDADAEFWFDGPPIPPLKSLDTTGNVIMLGALSKTLPPACDIGYIVAPTALVEPIHRAVQGGLESSPSLILQPAIARFINEGHLGRHIRRMWGVYAERRNVLSEVCQKDLSDIMDIWMPPSGTAATAFFKDELASKLSDVELHSRLRKHKIGALPLSRLYANQANARQGLLIGFASDVEEIIRGVGLISREARRHPVSNRNAPETRCATAHDQPVQCGKCGIS